MRKGNQRHKRSSHVDRWLLLTVGGTHMKAQRAAAAAAAAAAKSSVTLFSTTKLFFHVALSLCFLYLPKVKFPQAQTPLIQLERDLSLLSSRETRNACLLRVRPTQAQKHNPVFPLSREPGLRVCAIPSPRSANLNVSFPARLSAFLSCVQFGSVRGFLSMFLGVGVCCNIVRPRDLIALVDIHS